jgi:type IV secretory pathway VirD2 relaxase
MSFIEDELALALTDPVKRKANNTKNLRSQAAKVSSGVLEVMAKVTGFGRGAAHVKAHLSYITRHGDIEMENESGQIFQGKEEVKELFSEWAAEIGESARRKNQRDTMHLVLSMPETVDPVSVHQAVREFTRKTFSRNHDYVFALHTDTAHPHCHVTVKMRGYDGKALKTEKADLQTWRDGFAEALQLQGVEAAASPRRSRGIVKKAERSVIRHIERGDDKTPPRVPRVKALQVREVVREMISEMDGGPAVRHPWDDRIEARQQQVRQAWLKAAVALEQPRPIILFKKEPSNGQPNYDQLDPVAVRRGQRSAGLYQSGLEAARRQEPAAALTRLRDLSGLPLVQSQGTTQMLLHAHARPDLGHNGGRSAAARDGVRRAGDRVDGLGRADGARGERRLSGVGGGGGQEISAAELAAQIKGFVKNLPAIETARDVIRRDLRNHLRKEQERRQAATVPVKPQELPQEVPRTVDRGLDR